MCKALVADYPDNISECYKKSEENAPTELKYTPESKANKFQNNIQKYYETEKI